MTRGDKLKNKHFCDGCDELKNLMTLGGHRRCNIYKIMMLEKFDAYLANKGAGSFPRPDICMEEDKKLTETKVPTE